LKTAGQIVRDQVRAESPWVNQLVYRTVVVPQMANALYLLALCKHDQAAQTQAKAERGVRLGPDAVRSGWQDTTFWWAKFAEDHATDPAVPWARLGQAHARRALGDTGAAATLLEDLSGPISPLEKLGRLYEARQLRKR
jgi:hypothetical protein